MTGAVVATVTGTMVRRLTPSRQDNMPAPLSTIEEFLAQPETITALAELEASGSYPHDIVGELRARGLVDLLVPESASASQLSQLYAMTARRSGSLAITVGVNALALLPCYIAGTAEQLAWVTGRLRSGAFAAMLLSELEHGSNLLRNTASARPAGNGYRLDGIKQLINGGTEHTMLVALLRSSPMRPSGHALHDFTLFLVDRDDSVEALPRWRTLPTRAADISGVRFAGTWVPATAVIGAVGQGFAIVQKTLMVSHGGVAALASGAISGAVDLATTYAHTRDVYGAPIVTLGAISDHLLRMRALEVVVAAMAVKATAAINRFGCGAGYLSAVAKYVCCRLAEEAVSEGRHVLGARALLEDLPYARLIRDVLLYGVFDGSSHVVLEEISAALPRFVTTRHTATLEATRELYARPARPLVEATRQPWRRYAPPLVARCTDLAAATGDGLLGAVGALSRTLLDLTGAARQAGRWQDDQGLRFSAAALLAELEALLATGELGTPAGRAALGIPGACGPADAAAAEYALAWLGGRVAAGLRDLALLVGTAESESAVADLPRIGLDAVRRQRLCSLVVGEGVAGPISLPAARVNT